MLTRHDISWVNYESDTRSLGMRILNHWRALGARISRRGIAGSPLSTLPLQNDVGPTATVYPLGLKRARRHIRPLHSFFVDAGAGTLPSVSIIDPDFARNSGASPQDVSSSESFTAAVVDSLMYGANWPHTLLIWLHDTWGGYYDHCLRHLQCGLTTHRIQGSQAAAPAVMNSSDFAFLRYSSPPTRGLITCLPPSTTIRQCSS